MKVIFVAGPWGSGTTMVIGALDRLGVSTFGPHFHSKDPKTSNTFELMAFREVILNHVQESTMRPQRRFSCEADFDRDLTTALRQFGQRLERGELGLWQNDGPRVVALKMPLASMCLPQIAEAFDPKIVVIHRPFNEIEASRVRRKWATHFGTAGARKIYSKMFADLLKHKLSALMLSYSDFVADPRAALSKIIAYCELQHLEHNVGKAVSFVRKT